MSPCCFGAAPHADGSIVVAAQTDGQVNIERFDGVRAVVQFVRERSRSLCRRYRRRSARAGARRAAGSRGDPAPPWPRLPKRATPRASGRSEDGTAVALARYARHAL